MQCIFCQTIENGHVVQVMTRDGVNTKSHLSGLESMKGPRFLSLLLEKFRMYWHIEFQV
jgi:hypothetical protein